jgi:hypothetical protein
MGDTMATPPDRALWERWIDLWNGDFAAAADLVAEELTVHLPQHGMPDPASIGDSGALASWIVSFRSTFRDAEFTTELGPFSLDDGGSRYVAGRWRCTARWDRGARPLGARAASDTGVAYAGTDFLRIDRDGRIAEYWLSDDLLDVYATLGVTVPERAR